MHVTLLILTSRARIANVWNVIDNDGLFSYNLKWKKPNEDSFHEVITTDNEFYYREVNDEIIPHGIGIKVYKNGSLIEGNLKNAKY